ncbi:hypothetical protein CEXT_605831 [Caerostris extrusa]|uniref:Uncharacterized protein n=1 Tax=Caerostris extrusa TaxID=172846 RepID=A0AAV4W8W1_CAEEX|nr:hypothetical protein CEXT_605831 [Caerostris extrusa]
MTTKKHCLSSIIGCFDKDWVYHYIFNILSNNNSWSSTHNAQTSSNVLRSPPLLNQIEIVRPIHLNLFMDLICISIHIYPVGSLSAALTFSQGFAQGTPRGLPSFLAHHPPPSEETCCATIFENNVVLWSVFQQGGDVVKSGPVKALLQEARVMVKEKERTMDCRNTE